MKYRETFIRIVDPDSGIDRIEYRPFLLLRAARAAAEETVLGAPLCAAWLNLFQSHLSTSTRKLQWRGDLAESTEMRRAYSAMYGRYFSRGILESRLGITDFVPLNGTNTIIKNGVTVSRSRKGDIPDWIAWHSNKGSYVLAEAKGNLTGKLNEYFCGKPSCIEAGEAQFDRVDVNNFYCGIGTLNWVVANLWSTEVRGKHPVSLLWHSRKQGKKLENHEIPVHAAAIREHRILQIASRLVRDESLRTRQEMPYLNLRISIEPSDEYRIMEPEDLSILEALSISNFEQIEKPSTERHEDIYTAALITPLGIRPILDRTDLQFVRGIQRQVREGVVAAMIYGLSMRTVANLDYRQKTWLSSGGIASTDGTSLFNLKDVQLSEV